MEYGRRGSPTAVREDDGVGGDEIQADAAHGETGEHDTGFIVIVQGVNSTIPLVCRHTAVDPSEVDVRIPELVLHHVQERRPLREDDNLGAGLGNGGTNDLQHGLGLGALRLGIEFAIVVYALLGGRLQQAVFIEGVATHGAFVLDVDGLDDARAAEDVLAVGDDWLRRYVVAYGAVFLLLDVHSQGFL